MRKNYVLALLIAPAIGYMCLIVGYPFISSLILSFHQYNFVNPNVVYKFIGLSNYINLLHDPHFWRSFRNTFYFVSVAVPIELFLGIGIASLLNRSIKARSIIVGLLLVPAMTAPAVVGLIWRFMYHDQVGILQYFLSQLGVIQPNFAILANTRFAITAIITTDVWEWTPFVTLLVLAGLVALPKELDEASRIDGASNWQRFIYIRLPLLKSLLIAIVFLRTIEALKIFDIVYVLTRGGPGEATETLNLYAYRVNFRHFNMGYGATIVLFILAIVGACYLAIMSVYERATR